jgi:hypothetical protein
MLRLQLLPELHLNLPCLHIVLLCNLRALLPLHVVIGVIDNLRLVEGLRHTFEVEEDVLAVQLVGDVESLVGLDHCEDVVCAEVDLDQAGPEVEELAVGEPLERLTKRLLDVGVDLLLLVLLLLIVLLLPLAVD